MDSEVDGEDKLMQMEMSFKMISLSIIENQSLIYNLKFNSIFHNISINHL